MSAASPAAPQIIPDPLAKKAPAMPAASSSSSDPPASAWDNVAQSMKNKTFNDPEPSLADDFCHGTSVATCEASIRVGFLRKVYSILTAQILLTTLIAAVMMLVTPVRGFFLEHRYIPHVLLLPTLGLLVALKIYQNHHPTNLILLAAFTVSESITVGTVCAAFQAAHRGYIVLEAFALTALVFVSLTAYCFATKKDFSFLGGFLFSGLIVLLGAMLGNAVLESFGIHTPLRVLTNGVFGTMLFSGFVSCSIGLFFESATLSF